MDPGPQPPDLSTQVISLVPPVMLDTSGFLKQFGDCLVQPLPVVKRGMTVFALFVSIQLQCFIKNDGLDTNRINLISLKETSRFNYFDTEE